jgi:hypothetical protein
VPIAGRLSAILLASVVGGRTAARIIISTLGKGRRRTVESGIAARLAFSPFLAHLRELAQRDADIMSLSLGAGLNFEPLLDCPMSFLGAVIPGGIDGRSQLKPDVVHRIKEINAVDCPMVGPQYLEAIGGEPIVPPVDVFPGGHFERQVVEDPVRRMLDPRHLRNPRRLKKSEACSVFHAEERVQVGIRIFSGGNLIIDHRPNQRHAHHTRVELDRRACVVRAVGEMMMSAGNSRPGHKPCRRPAARGIDGFDVRHSIVPLGISQLPINSMSKTLLNRQNSLRPSRAFRKRWSYCSRQQRKDTGRGAGALANFHRDAKDNRAGFGQFIGICDILKTNLISAQP